MTKYKGPHAIVLQQAKLPLVSHDQCAAVNGALREVEKFNMLCAGYGGNSSISGCHGDSGGPFVCQEDGGRWFLRGIVSWGDNECKGKSYSVFARVSSFIDWIDYHMTKGPLQRRKSSYFLLLYFHFLTFIWLGLAWPYFTLLCFWLFCVVSRRVALRCVALRWIDLLCAALLSIALRCVALRCVALFWIALRWFALLCHALCFAMRFALLSYRFVLHFNSFVFLPFPLFFSSMFLYPFIYFSS